jgi:hypothetical protein
MKPQIVIEEFSGKHNSDLIASSDRLLTGNTYKDLSTICIIPVVGIVPQGGQDPIPVIAGKVCQNWLSMMTPMNQKFIRMFVFNMEVGQAYNAAIESILSNPDLSKWKYIMTLETDNMTPPDGLLKLYENIGKYDAIGGLYWTKGEGGQPMIYGDPSIHPKNFIPQIPKAETLQEANGLGMGFNLFKMEIFKDPRIPKPWFKTVQDYQAGVGVKCYTQDLYFYENAGKYGYKFACDTRVKVGHYDINTDIVW